MTTVICLVTNAFASNKNFEPGSGLYVACFIIDILLINAIYQIGTQSGCLS